MRDLYIKHGRAVRWEHGYLVSVAEAGRAVETEQLFTAEPLGQETSLPELPTVAVEDVARQLEKLGPERLIVSEGVAWHNCNGIEWTEHTTRLYVALTASGERALIDLSTFDVSAIERVAAALARLGPERVPPTRLLLEPAVGAALLPALAAWISVEQNPGAHDGKGLAVMASSGPPWPNWYRPSYRSRPVRMPFHLRAIAFGEVDESLPRAIAVLGPIGSRSVRVLCVEGERVYPTVATLGRPEAVGAAEGWYPHGAGSLGARMVLRSHEAGELATPCPFPAR